MISTYQNANANAVDTVINAMVTGIGSKQCLVPHRRREMVVCWMKEDV